MTIESKTHMDEGVRKLQDAFEVCEKIVRTPLPLSYSRHTSRFLVSWLTFLPFCAWRELGWATVPVDVILGFFLLGIEEIGVQIEEPLGVLPLEHWTGVIDARTRQVADEAARVRDLAARALAGTLGGGSIGGGGGGDAVPASPTALAALAAAGLPAEGGSGSGSGGGAAEDDGGGERPASSPEPPSSPRRSTVSSR